jgi:nucleoside 2-deoxyribosyltransferase
MHDTQMVGRLTGLGHRTPQSGGTWSSVASVSNTSQSRATSACTPRCYIASPLGFSEAGRYYYNRVLLPALAEVVAPVDPWALTPSDAFADARATGTLDKLVLAVGRRNIEAIRSCSLLVAILDGQEPDAGTVAEIGYACALSVRCYGLRSDLRQSGEEGAIVNLQVETFVAESGGCIVPSLEGLLDVLRQHAGVASGRVDVAPAAPN